MLTLKDWAPIRSFIDRETIIDRDPHFSGSSCVFIEKILFLVMAVIPLLSRF